MTPNSIDTKLLAIDVATSVAMAQFDELEAQCFRLVELVDCYGLTKQDAADIAWTAAVASDLVRKHGADVIQEVIAGGFSLAPEGGAE